MRVNDVFGAASLSGTMWSAISVLLEKNPAAIFSMAKSPSAERNFSW